MCESAVPPRGRFCYPQPTQYQSGDVTGHGAQPKNTEEDPRILRSARQPPGTLCGRRPQENCFPLSLGSCPCTSVSWAPSHVHPRAGDPVPPSICCPLPFGPDDTGARSVVLSLQGRSQQRTDCWAALGCSHHGRSSEHLPPTVPGSEALRGPAGMDCTLLGSVGTCFVHWFLWGVFGGIC